MIFFDIMSLEKKIEKEEKKQSFLQRIRQRFSNSVGAICLTATTSLIAPSFGSGCVHHKIYTPEEEISDAQPPKPSPLPSPIDAKKLDGHYNVEIENEKITYKKESLKTYSPFYGTVDFRSFDNKKGTLMFGRGGPFFWIDPSIEIDEKGEFKATVNPRPMHVLTSWYGFKLEIKDGKFIGDNIEAKVIETQYEGYKEDTLKPVAVLEYKLTGNQRFELKKTPAKLIEGEYKTLTTKLTNTCQFQTLPNGDYYFPITIVPQGKDTEGKDIMDINIEDILGIPELPIELDGTIKKTTYKSGDDSYIVEGKVDPNKINLKINFMFNFSNGRCTQKYEMEGKKRFEEANGTEKTFDGIYSSLMSMKYNTCLDKETYNKRRHFDILRIKNSSKAILKIGQLEFTLDVGKEGQITSEYEDTWNQFSADLSGSVKPNSINLTLDLTQRSSFFPTCYQGYKIVGKKLYKSK